MTVNQRYIKTIRRVGDSRDLYWSGYDYGHGQTSHCFWQVVRKAHIFKALKYTFSWVSERDKKMCRDGFKSKKKIEDISVLNVAVEILNYNTALFTFKEKNFHGDSHAKFTIRVTLPAKIIKPMFLKVLKEFSYRLENDEEDKRREDRRKAIYKELLS